MKNLGKFVSIFMAMVLVFTCILPSFNNARAASLDVANTVQSEDTDIGLVEFDPESVFTETELNEIADAIDIMDTYIIQNKNKLEINPDAKKHVSPFVFDFYIKSIDNINTIIQEGAAELSQESYSLSPLMSIEEMLANSILAEEPIIPSEEVNIMSWKGYWWGLEWTLSKSQADRWQNRFSDYSYGWGSVAAITGLLASVFPRAYAASAAALIMSVGNYYMFRIIRDNKSSRGTIITFKWAPPSVKAKKR